MSDLLAQVIAVEPNPMAAQAMRERLAEFISKGQLIVEALIHEAIHTSEGLSGASDLELLTRGLDFEAFGLEVTLR